ncbi:hypothetical protein ABVT39_004746 [Epinephelus coioides]
MTWTLMVALMNTDDAYDKDLLFVFPWSPSCGQQRTNVIEDEKEKKESTFVPIPDVALKPPFAISAVCVHVSVHGGEELLNAMFDSSGEWHSYHFALYVIHLFWFLTKSGASLMPFEFFMR